MKYMILIHRNPAATAAFMALPSEQVQEGLDVYRRLDEELQASGEMVAAAALADLEAGTRLPAEEGAAFGEFATDGPFAEVTEYVGGFYLVDVESEERALEIGRRIPEAALGLVEVRPTMDLSAFDV